MATTVIMPQLGESIAEGKISKWLKREGERVERDESLVEVATDKATVEVPAPVAGVLTKILAKEGAVVPIKKDIALIEEGKAAQAPAPQYAKTGPPPAQAVPARKPSPKIEGAPPAPKGKRPAPEPAKDERHYSPLVRRLAEQHGLDLSQVRGSGAGGRVTKQDLLGLIPAKGGRPAAKGRPPKPQEPVAAAPPEPEKPAPPAAAAAAPAEPEDQTIPLAGMRKIIAEHMVRSKRTAPHVTTITDVDMTEVVRLREAAKEKFQQVHGVKLTYMPFIIQATARALRQYPYLNSSLIEEKIILKRRIHIGVAVSTETGLIVPVIRNADQLSIVELAKTIEALAGRARSGKLKPDDIHGGTFSITNPGVFGGLLSTPIIFQPQAAILGVQRISKMPVVINDMIAIRSMMYLCLSYDHRIVDGATSVQFLQYIRKQLEEAKFTVEA